MLDENLWAEEEEAAAVDGLGLALTCGRLIGWNLREAWEASELDASRYDCVRSNGTVFLLLRRGRGRFLIDLLLVVLDRRTGDGAATATAAVPAQQVRVQRQAGLLGRVGHDAGADAVLKMVSPLCLSGKDGSYP